MRRGRIIITIATAAALVAGGAAIAGAAGVGDDDAAEQPLTGEALERATSSALADTPGRVTGTEVEDEESAYEVEVTRADGSQVDVQLDHEFRVVSSATDDENDD